MHAVECARTLYQEYLYLRFWLHDNRCAVAGTPAQQFEYAQQYERYEALWSELRHVLSLYPQPIQGVSDASTPL